MKGVLLAGGELGAAEEGRGGVQMVSPLLPKLTDRTDAQAGLHTTGCHESKLAHTPTIWNLRMASEDLLAE